MDHSHRHHAGSSDRQRAETLKWISFWEEFFGRPEHAIVGFNQTVPAQLAEVRVECAAGRYHREAFPKFLLRDPVVFKIRSHTMMLVRNPSSKDSDGDRNRPDAWVSVYLA